VDAASFLEKLSLEDESKLPDTVVHGTFHAAWPAILASGGLRCMGRNQVHFATGPPLDSVLDEGAKGLDGEKVISGMRRDAQVLIYVDLRKALAAGCPFWRSENGVILSEGMATGEGDAKQGVVPVEFFDVAVEKKQGMGKIWERGVEIQALPEDLIKKGNPKGKRGSDKNKEKKKVDTDAQS
jgi:2'-phosphotransferase